VGVVGEHRADFIWYDNHSYANLKHELVDNMRRNFQSEIATYKAALDVASITEFELIVSKDDVTVASVKDANVNALLKNDGAGLTVFHHALACDTMVSELIDVSKSLQSEPPKSYEVDRLYRMFSLLNVSQAFSADILPTEAVIVELSSYCRFELLPKGMQRLLDSVTTKWREEG
jgi:hypothetical protein